MRTGTPPPVSRRISGSPMLSSVASVPGATAVGKAGDDGLDAVVVRGGLQVLHAGDPAMSAAGSDV